MLKKERSPPHSVSHTSLVCKFPLFCQEAEIFAGKIFRGKEEILVIEDNKIKTLKNMYMTATGYITYTPQYESGGEQTVSNLTIMEDYSSYGLQTWCIA